MATRQATSSSEGILERLGIFASNAGAGTGRWLETKGPEVISENPATGEPIARVRQALRADYEAVMIEALRAFESWRLVPAPRRGEVIRALGNALRESKEDLGRLVSLENGKVLSEGLGEVQEMIDICDFAVGLSRQLYGLAMHSERPSHRMYEQWHPLGPVGVITAFNFPAAVWSWNALIAAVCGDAMVWKPSPKTPLTAVAISQIVGRVLARNGHPDVMAMLV